MSFGSQPYLPIKEQPKIEDCIIEKPQKEKRVYSTEFQRLPLVKELNHTNKNHCRKANPNDKHPKDDTKQDINLPKLWDSPKRMDAGEPNDSTALKDSEEQFSIDSSMKCSPFKRSLWFESSSSDASEGPDQIQSKSNALESSSKFKFHINATDLKEEEPKEEEECNALKRWKYWMKDKKAMQDYLSKKIGRDPEELLLQESDKYREVMEKKMMLWYSKLPEPDMWRGSPARWKPALRIRDTTGKPTRQQYCFVKSKVEKEERPELELIGLPNTIKKEKGLVTEKGMVKKKLLSRVHVLKTKSKSSHEIDLTILEIIGEKISSEAHNDKNYKSLKCSPEIIEPEVTPWRTKLSSESKCMDERPRIFCLVIDGEEIKYEVGIDDCQDVNETFQWQVNFGGNTIKSIVEKVLRIENRGTMAIRYDWLSPNTVQQLSMNPLQCNPKQYEPWFFFNKNSGVFLPGQIYDLKFYFYAKSSGIRKEIWHLKTTPPLPSTVKYATITLSGVATEELSALPSILGNYLNYRVLNTSIAVLLEIILNKVTNSIEYYDIEYRSIFSEKVLFEHHNPQYFYHSMIVRQLKEFLEEIPDVKEWDFSLHSLIHRIKTHKTGRERTDCLFEISRQAKALLRPNYVSVKNSMKHRMTYGALCKMINLIEDDYFYLKNLFLEKVEDSSIWNEQGEGQETSVNSDLVEEEMGEFNYKKEDFYIRPINLMFFKNFFYLKVYYRICAAVEHMVGIIETRKFFEPRKQVNQNLTKPARTGKFSAAHLAQKSIQVTPKCPMISMRKESLQYDY